MNCEPHCPKRVIASTIKAAATTPKKFAAKAFQKGIPRTQLTMDPDHAPVPGNGTPTNATRAANSWSFQAAALLRDRSNSQSKNFFTRGLCCDPHFARGSNPRRMSGTGTILPRMARTKTSTGSSLRIRMLTGIAPLSSTTGRAASRNGMSQSANFPRVASTSFSAALAWTEEQGQQIASNPKARRPMLRRGAVLGGCHGPNPELSHCWGAPLGDGSMPRDEHAFT
mmetsp:Transcript_14495/g.40826  ORF Transcript_14495/g.40826 Transcript_14495/m.40826 type:complete len:226 (-) Transcript_14495:268-945(-)